MEMIKKEWKSIGKNRILLISFIVICFIPMLYASFFLKGIWDPYGKTSNLPVAVVNNDKSVTYEGKTLNAGEELVNNLKEDSNLNWNFVSSKEAQDGLESRKYYMVVTIPEDFSANAATVMDTNPKQMNITYETNGALNYLGEVISDSAAKQLKSEVSSKITNQYVSTIFEKFPEIKDGFSQAADGAGQINDGLAQLNDGIGELDSKVPDLSNGVTQLSDGSSTLATGVYAYTKGVDVLSAGTSTLAGNSSSLQAGTNSLVSGISDGTKLLQAGTNQLSDGLELMSSKVGTKLTEGKGQIALLNQGLTNINNGLQALNSKLNDGSMGTSTEKLTADLKSIGVSASLIGKDLASIQSALGNGTKDSLTALATEAAKQGLTPEQTQALLAAVKEKLDAENAAVGSSAKDIGAQATSIGTSTTDVATIMNSISASLTELKQTVSLLSDGSKVALPGAQTAISQLTSGLVDVKTALDGQAVPGVAQLEAGITKLQVGLNDGSAQYNEGLSKYIAGVDQINTGAQTLSSNSSKLNNGASAVNNGLATLNGQIPTLQSGVTALATGSLQLKDGSSELSSKLKDGTAKVNAVNTSANTVNMISEPTTITKDKFSNVPNYGHALAPYVLSLALYVGCLVFNFVFPIRKIAVKEKSAFEWWLSKVSVGVAAAVAMALIEGGTMILLGLSPENMGEYFGTAIITSLTFMFLIMFLAMAFDNPGRFVAMVLLVLQLAASGGTFPMPLTDTFFKDIHELLPMTHCIYAFRQAISSGLGTSFYADHMIVLVCILVVSIILLLLTMMLLKAHHRENVSQLDDNQKLLDDNYSYN